MKFLIELGLFGITVRGEFLLDISHLMTIMLYAIHL